MRLNSKLVLAKLLQRVRFRPLSLAEKCRLMFGAAVIFSMMLVLLFPYTWMRMLTRKDILDVCNERANALYRSHFQSPLEPSGGELDPNSLPIQWIRFTGVEEDDFQAVTADQKVLIKSVLEDLSLDHEMLTDRANGMIQSHYVKVFRANESCRACHNPQGSAGPFSPNEAVGAALVVYRDLSGEIGKIRLVSRVGTLIAGLIGGTGAIVAFYWITQHVFLRPIRQLRAIANNVADGNLDIRSTIATGDEYQRLAEAFNHMLDNLEAAQVNLREANKQLDSKIVELSDRNIELFQANALKSEFLANMSHEFRTPLNAILGFAQVIRDKPALLSKEKERRYAENIITSGNRLLVMINDLLQLAKTRSDKMELHIERASMHQVVETLVSSLALLAKEKKIKIKSHVDADIPVLNTDIGKVQQILHNLFSNAVKFTDRRGRIELHAGMIEENTVRISVKDNGCGISSEDQEKIFQKFRQVDGSITRQSSGTGLGLAISRELATMVAGHVGLESEKGHGATFWLELPVTLGLDEDAG